MNAKSERASLPDRVEAAARAIYDVDYADPEVVQYAWHVLDDVRRGTYRDMAVAALAAADACEAERPNRPVSPWRYMPDGGDSAHRAGLREAIARAAKRERNYDQPWWAANMKAALDYIEQLEWAERNALEAKP